MLNSLIACVVGSIRPIACVVPPSMNHRAPSGPTTIEAPGRLPGFRPLLNSLIACVVGLIIPIALVVPWSVNHRLPSGPATSPCCRLAPAFRPALNSVIACVVGLIIPIALVVPLSVNQTFPSGPAAIPSGMLPAGRLNSLMACVVGLIIPIALVVPGSLNHMLPSGPIAIDRTALPGFRPLVKLSDRPAVVIWPTAPFRSLNQRFPSGPATTWAGLVPGALNSVIVPSGAAPASAALDKATTPSSSANWMTGRRVTCPRTPARARCVMSSIACSPLVIESACSKPLRQREKEGRASQRPG